MATIEKITCPHCGGTIERFKNPIPSVDIIIELEDESIVMVYRRNEPVGWALPGGFVDYGETLEEAARREALEETSLEITNLKQMHTYSDPERDPRHHTITTVFTSIADGTPRAGDDAVKIGLFTKDTLPGKIAFDHRRILLDYFKKSSKS